MENEQIKHEIEWKISNTRKLLWNKTFKVESMAN